MVIHPVAKDMIGITPKAVVTMAEGMVMDEITTTTTAVRVVIMTLVVIGVVEMIHTTAVILFAVGICAAGMTRIDIRIRAIGIIRTNVVIHTTVTSTAVMMYTAVVTPDMMMARLTLETPIAPVMETDVEAMIVVATVMNETEIAKEVTKTVMTTLVPGVIAGQMSRIKWWLTRIVSLRPPLSPRLPLPMFNGMPSILP